jgi:hypothetical protein
LFVPEQEQTWLMIPVWQVFPVILHWELCPYRHL